MSHDREEGADIRTLGLLLVLFLLVLFILWLIQSLSTQQKTCPKEAFSCDSSCGCCVKDGFGNPIPYCDTEVCGQGYVLNSRGQCCSINDLSQCIKREEVCLNPQQCNEQNPCCPGYSCNTAGSCMPCSKNMLCNPEDVNSCCEGYACNANGRCEPLTSCSMRECDKVGEPCKVCDSAGNCAECQDKSVCVYNSKLKKNVCALQGDCPAGYHLNDDLRSPCKCISNTDNSCPSCIGKSCSADNVGKSCSLCDASGKCTTCPEQICANVEGTYSCVDKGKCAIGYECKQCASGCCNAEDGSCIDIQNNKCIGDLKPCATCESGCCNPDGTCPACTSITCDADHAKQACSVYCTGDECMPCSDKICVNIIGGGPNVYECLAQGNAPYGFVEDEKCEYGIRDPQTGECVDKSHPSVVKDSPEGYECIKVKAKSENKLLNININLPPLYCNSTGCYLESELPEGADIIYYCKDNKKCPMGICPWKPFTPKQFEIKKLCPKCPDDFIDAVSNPPEICLDCISACSADGRVYDLNGDTYLDRLDIEIFNNFLASKQYDRRYDFNNDNVVDEKDLECLSEACTSEGCHVVNISSATTCISLKAYPPEARAALGEQVHNVVSAPVDFNAYKTQYPKYANAFDQLHDEIIKKIGTGVIIAGGNANIPIYISVERGNPYIYGSSASIEKEYFSGCVYFTNEKKSTAPTDSIQVMLLEREPGCKPELHPQMTDTLDTLIDTSIKNAFGRCIQEDCDSELAWVELTCKLSVPGKCVKVSSRPGGEACNEEDTKCKECISALNEKCTELATLVSTNCYSKSLSFSDFCGSKTYEQCTTSNSKKSWCNNLVGSVNTQCPTLANSLRDEYKPLWNDLCNTGNFAYLACGSSFDKCNTDMSGFKNIVKIMIRDQAVKLIDKNTGVTSELDPSEVSKFPTVSATDICPLTN